MKKLLLSCALMAVTASAFAQGTVNFANASSTAGWPAVVDRNAKWAANAASYNAALVAGANVSSNYAGVNLAGLRAALYFGTGSDVSLFTQAAGSLSTFKSSTSTTAGSWFSKNPVTLTGIPSGTATTLAVVVWDSLLSADPFSAAALTGLRGVSTPFAYTPPGGSATPDQYLMLGLTSFNVGIVPEPSTFALLGLGALGLAIFRRK